MAVQDYELLLRVRADLLQAISGLDSVKKTLGDTGNAADDMGKRGGKAGDALAKGGDKATNSMRLLKQAIAAVGIAKLVKDYFDAADAASTMAAKVRLVTDSASAQADAQKKLFALAQQTSSSLENTTNLYVKLA